MNCKSTIRWDQTTSKDYNPMHEKIFCRTIKWGNFFNFLGGWFWKRWAAEGMIHYMQHWSKASKGCWACKNRKKIMGWVVWTDRGDWMSTDNIMVVGLAWSCHYWIAPLLRRFLQIPPPYAYIPYTGYLLAPPITLPSCSLLHPISPAPSSRPSPIHHYLYSS